MKQGTTCMCSASYQASSVPDFVHIDAWCFKNEKCGSTLIIYELMIGCVSRPGIMFERQFVPAPPPDATSKLFVISRSG